MKGHEFYIKRVKKFTIAWNCSKYLEKIARRYKCRISAFTQNGQLIRVNGEDNPNASIGKPATRKITKQINALSENLMPADAVASGILPVTDVLSTQYALLSKHNSIQLSQRLRKRMQTVSIHEPSERHFHFPDRFEGFLWYDNGKNDHQRFLIFGDSK